MTRFHCARIALALGMLVLSGDSWLCGDCTADEPPNLYSSYPGVCLDAGHGGSNAGKWSPPYDNGDRAGTYGPGPDSLTEAWVNHEIVSLVKPEVEVRTHVRCTKSALTEYMSPQDRCDIANADPFVDAFVSVHHEGDIRVHDTRTFYADIGSNPALTWKYKLALGLANEINRQSEFGYGMQVKPDTESGFPSGLTVLRNTRMPATLTEASCIKHQSEEDLMAYSAEHREGEGFGIRDGFFAYADSFTCPQDFWCYRERPDQGETARIWFLWDHVEGASGYYFCKESEAWCPPSLQSYCVPVSVNWFMLEDWQVGYFDCFAVRAYVDGPPGHRFFGGWSDTRIGHQCWWTGIDREIRNFTASGGDHMVVLDWEAVSFDAGRGFEIWRSTNGGQSYGDSCIGYVPFDPLHEEYSFVDSTPEYLMLHYYKILDTEGYDWWGPAYAPAYNVPKPPAPCPTPELAVSRLGDQHIHLCVEQGSEYADYYLLSWMPEGGAWADTVHRGERCLDRIDLQNGIAYCFRARGTNSTAVTDSSAAVWAMPLVPPANLRAEADHQSIHLSWDGASSASGYMVYYSTDEWDPWAYSVDVGDTLAATLTGLENGVLYYACVVAYDRFGNETEASNLVSARPDCWGAVSGTESPSSFALGKSYPNPFDGLASIPYELAKPCARVSLAVYDARGRVIRRLVNEARPAGRYEMIWDGTDREGRSVPPGLYFYRLEAGDFSRTEKMLFVR